MGCSQSKDATANSKPSKKGEKSKKKTEKGEKSNKVEDKYNNSGNSLQRLSDSGSAGGGSKTTRFSQGSARVTLTKGALGKNAREEEDGKSVNSVGSPKSSRNTRGGFDIDDGKSVASASDRESVMTSESFFELAGKKVNRPRSAKGHPAPEPTAEQMADRIKRHGMKGLLSDIDDSVPTAHMIRRPNWEKMLTDKRRGALSKGGAQEDIPGIVAIVDVNNQTGDKALDDVLSLMSHFPCVQGADAPATGPNAPKKDPKAFLDVGHGVKEENSDEDEEEKEQPDDDDMRRTSFLVKPGKSSGSLHGRASALDEAEIAVGRFHFAENGKKINKYYERHVKPWILDYLFDREQIDTSIQPFAGGLASMTVVHSTGSFGSPAADPSITVASPGMGPDSAFNARMAYSVTEFGDNSFQGPGKDPLASRTTNDSGPSQEDPGLSVANSAFASNKEGSGSVLVHPDQPPLNRTPKEHAMGEDEVMRMMM